MKRRLKTNRWLQYALLTAVCMLLSSQRIWAETNLFSEVKVVGGGSSCYEDYPGWNHYDQDLNDGAGGDYIYLLAKKKENLPDGEYITDFCIVVTDTWAVPDEMEEDGITWHLAPYDGDSHFKSSKGDLNCGASGKSIYLYYTKTPFADKRAVKSIWFNSEKSGSVSGADHDFGDGWHPL